MAEPYRIVPAGWLPLWGLLPILFLFGLVLGVMAFAFASAQRATFEITDTVLRIKGELYGRDIPLEQLRSQEAKVVNLHSSAKPSGLQPIQRSFGTSLPGYQAGWFRLRDGRRALVYLTERRHVVYIPTTEDYVVLLSVQEPKAFVEALKHRANP